MGRRRKKKKCKSCKSGNAALSSKQIPSSIRPTEFRPSICIYLGIYLFIPYSMCSPSINLPSVVYFPLRLSSTLTSENKGNNIQKDGNTSGRKKPTSLSRASAFHLPTPKVTSSFTAAAIIVAVLGGVFRGEAPPDGLDPYLVESLSGGEVLVAREEVWEAGEHVFFCWDSTRKGFKVSISSLRRGGVRSGRGKERKQR